MTFLTLTRDYELCKKARRKTSLAVNRIRGNPLVPEFYRMGRTARVQNNAPQGRCNALSGTAYSSILRQVGMVTVSVSMR